MLERCNVDKIQIGTRILYSAPEYARSISLRCLGETNSSTMKRYDPSLRLRYELKQKSYENRE